MKTTVSTIGRPKHSETIFRGIGRDARKLGVHREHLRLVASGKRTSPKLLERYLALLERTNPKLKERIVNQPRFSQPATSQPAAPDNGIDPASAFLGWEYIDKVLTPLKYTAVTVEFQGRDVDYVLHKAGPGFEKNMGEELGQAGLAEWDSTYTGDPFFIFFHAGKGCLPATLLAIKDKLAHLEILRVSKIGFADPTIRKWRTYYPELPGHSVI